MNAVKCRKVVAAWLAVALLSSMLTACGTSEVGVERTPAPDQAATATVSILATQVATLAVPTSTPTPSLGKLAYVQSGDIWVKALPDGEPQRLTTDGRNSKPRWSPSGEWLAFRKGDYQVWVMSTDGNSARPLNEGAAVDAFAWAPADDRLAYVAAAGLQVISTDGAAPVTLVPPSLPDHGPGRMGRIAWSPDGAWIACGWQEWQPGQPLTYQGLWRVSSDGEQLAELYVSGAPEKGDAILAGWSPDGQHILFWQGEMLSGSMLADGVPLYSLPAGGGEPVQLARQLASDARPSTDKVLAHSDFVAPAPASAQVAVTVGAYRATWMNKRVAVVEAGTDAISFLTTEDLAAFSPSWSPDSTRLAYVAMPDKGDLVGGEDARLGMMERRIWVANVQGEPQLQQVTDDPTYRDERSLWSADGSHLLFARMDADGQASLWLILVEGGKPRRVVDELSPLPDPAAGWFGYYGHIEWDDLFDWWRGPARTPAGVMVPTPGPPPTARPPVSPTPTPPPPTPTPTIVLTATRTYTDTAHGFAIDYPADWEADGVRGGFVLLWNPATSGEERQAINIAALAEPSLEAMLHNVERGSFGPYLIMAESVQLGGLEALKVTLRQAPEGLSLLWLVITPQSQQQGQGLTIAAYGDPALAEAIVATWRPVPLPNATAMPQPTAPAQDLAPGTEAVIDCADIYPGLPGCLRKESLVGGRLAFVDSRPPFDDRPTVIDLERGGVWTLGESPAWLYNWSPSGNSLLVGGADVPMVWHYDGQNHNPISSPQTLFWAPRSSFEGGEEQLAIVAKDGSLVAACYTASDSTACGERLLLSPGSLGNDGRGIVRWSPDGWLAWSLNTDQLTEASQFEQMLYVRPAEGDTEVTAWRLSDDIREAYYQIMDWVPGTRFILAARGMLAVSLWSWGVPIVTINADTGEITDLDAAMLLTLEAYAWHPAQPGLLALAEGGSRYLFETGRLALLDVTSGELTYLTGEDMAAFEPAWSPNGTLLAYAAVPTSPDAKGDGTTLEHTLDGRAIHVVNPQSGEPHRLTDPGDGADGWPQWSADGTRLLYTRQHDGYTDVRVVTLDGNSDQLLVTGLPDPICYYGGCGWRQMLAYYSGLYPVSAGWKTYANSVFNVTLKYPAEWRLMPEYGARYGGEDGFFGLDAISGGQRTIDQVYPLVAYHKLQPYGSQPTIERLQVQGRDACLILPSDDQPADMKGNAALVVQYPQPVQISGERYRYFILYADQDHIREIAHTLKFEEPEACHTYTDTALGFAIDYPAGWEADGVRGGFVLLWNPATSGDERQAINIAALAEPSLEAMLDNVERGSFGPYVISAEPAQLGGLEALRVTLRQAPEGLSLLWLVITPQSQQQGQGLTIAAYGDPAQAEAILATWRPMSSGEAHDLYSARQALMAYLSLLHEQRYSEAINYYGGTYDALRDWNPTVAQDDYATLFKNGCTMNGLKCLSIRTIVCEEQVSPTEFRFTVEFMNDDRSVFVLGPCCDATETEMPPQTQFVYKVKRVEDRFLVQDLPVYVP